MTLKGTTKEFPLEVILRLLTDSKKTGELAMRGPKGEGALGIADGRVITAVYGTEKPIPALGAVFDLGEVDFEFVPWTEAPAANLEGSLEENLKRADEYAKWLADVRGVIPHDGIRFRLSERAADQGAVTFTADRWRVVMAVNTRPSVTELASNLHIDRDDALTTLAGLVRDGVIETTDEPAPAAGPAPAPGPPIGAEISAPAQPAPTEPAPATPAAPEPSEDWTAALVRKAAAQTTPEPEAEPSPPPPAAAESAPMPTPPPTPSTSAPADAWSAIPSPPPAAQGTTDAAPVPDWTSETATEAPAWSPAPSAPPATDWGEVPTTPLPEDAAPPPPPPDWTSGAPASSAEWTAPPQEWSPAQAAPPPDWTSAPAPTEPPPFIQEAAPSAPASFGTPEPAAPEAPAAEPAAEPAAAAANEWAPAQPAEPAPLDDRLAALQGMFDKPAPAQPTQEWTAPASDTWVTPGKPAPAAEDPRLSAMSAPAPAQPVAPTSSSTPNEWAPPASIGAPAQPKKGGGLFGGLFGGKKTPQAGAGASSTNGGAESRAGKLAAFSNALLTEYTSGTYGKGKVDDRMPSLLMRVDEQADPIDRPLPIVDDRLDVQALERVNMAEQQAVPYLATLVATIFGDAEKAFGKDKARRGYKAAQQQIFGGDTSALSGPDLAGKLPKV